MTTPSRRGKDALTRAALGPAKAALGPAGRAAMRPARALADILRYWHAERSTLRQGMISLSVSAMGNIPTGLALGAMEGRLRALPGLLILIPAAIGMRGAIFGALGSRLGTSIHAGTLRFTRERSGVLGQNISATILLSFMVSLFLALVARVVTAAMGLASISIWDYVVISVIGGLLSGGIILVLTVWLARFGSERGWDLDSVAAPVITFIGDTTTLPALWIASLLAQRTGLTVGVGAVCAAGCLVAAYEALRTKLPVARRIVRESLLTLALASVINTLAGTVAQSREERFFAFPALLVMLPPFLENAGALGGIVSSRLASKLHMGAVRPRLWPERLAALDISLAGPWALLNFALTGVSAHVVTTWLGKPSPGAWQMTVIALVAGALATAGAAVVAYASAVATFRFDLDPDNHGIAAVTSVMDLVGVICVVATVSFMGVG